MPHPILVTSWFSSHEKVTLVFRFMDEQGGDQIYGISKLDGDGKPQPPLLLDNKVFNINTKSHEGASSFSADSSEIFTSMWR